MKSLYDYADVEEVEETGDTFEENAIIKAEALSKQIQQIVIADDSGLIVDALNGKPGVRSSRYAGEDKNDEANIQKVLQGLKNVQEEKRTARFFTVPLPLRFQKKTKKQ
ncbi:hypothetical protein GCM10020331_034070 [Ectobacillus funiculus]